MLAFGAGGFIVEVAFELFQPAHLELGLGKAAAGLAVGSIVFIALDLLLERYTGQEATGLALVAAVVLDAIPESSRRPMPQSPDRVVRGVARRSRRGW